LAQNLHFYIKIKKELDMADKSSLVKKAGIAIAVVAVVGGFLGWCWTIKDTPESRRADRRATVKELRQCKNADIIPFFEKLSTEKSFHASFNKSFPWFKCGFDTRVSTDYIAQLVADSFIRLAGTGDEASIDKENIKKLIAFSNTFMPKCSLTAANSIRERCLDGYFLIKDYPNAIKILEDGLPSRSKAWCAGTAAKLRFHVAEEAKNWADAEKSLLEFNKFMMSDEQKNFEDCDPTTGIIYSREWVVAKNLLRCADCASKQNAADRVTKYKAEAKVLFATALEKAKDDKKSHEALQKEVKSAAL
jgi:hypothetical protein